MNINIRMMIGLAFKIINKISSKAKRDLKRTYYRFRLGKIGKNVQICSNVKIFGPENIFLGDNVTINEFVIIQSCEGAKIYIGNNVRISYSAMIITGKLKMDREGELTGEHIGKDIEIGDNVWICAGSIILGGVKIGNGTIIGAGAIISSDIPEKTYVRAPRPKIISL